MQWRRLALALLVCPLALSACSRGARSPSDLQRSIVAARDEAKAACEGKNAKAAGKAAARADANLARLRAQAREGPNSAEAASLVGECAAVAREAREWADLADEERRGDGGCFPAYPGWGKNDSRIYRRRTFRNCPPRGSKIERLRVLDRLDPIISAGGLKYPGVVRYLKIPVANHPR